VSEEENDSFKLVDATGDLVGSIAGASIASLHQGVGGIFEAAVIMPGVAHTLKYLAGLFLKRGMAKREQQRVGLVYGLTAVAIQKRLADGEHIRADDFFNRDITDRSKADELAEAVLIAGQREHEERKLRYLANLNASFASDSHIDQGTANYLVKLATALTYRQYCLLEIANNRHGYNLRPPGLLNLSKRENAPQVFAVLAECFELHLLDLVKFTDQFGLITKIEDMAVQSMALEIPMGAYLHIGMRLQEIGVDDVANVAKLISSH
jgi:hypothetical protein